MVVELDEAGVDKNMVFFQPQICTPVAAATANPANAAAAPVAAATNVELPVDTDRIKYDGMIEDCFHERDVCHRNHNAVPIFNVPGLEHADMPLEPPPPPLLSQEEQQPFVMVICAEWQMDLLKEYGNEAGPYLNSFHFQLNLFRSGLPCIP